MGQCQNILQLMCHAYRHDRAFPCFQIFLKVQKFEVIDYIAKQPFNSNSHLTHIDLFHCCCCSVIIQPLWKGPVIVVWEGRQDLHICTRHLLECWMNTAVTRWGYHIGQALHYHAAFLPWDYIQISYHAWRVCNRLKLDSMDFLVSIIKHIRWNRPGRTGRTVQSIKPQQLSRAAPFWCITAAKVSKFSGCNHPWSKSVSTCCHRSWIIFRTRFEIMHNWRSGLANLWIISARIWKIEQILRHLYGVQKMCKYRNFSKTRHFKIL